MIGDCLDNYRALVARVDEFSTRIYRKFPGEFHCRRGCDACCRHLTLFPVEGMALRAAWRRLPPRQRDDVSRRVAAAPEDGPCPLLEDHACLLYEARPIICRTHGLPLLYRGEEEAQVTCCPLNFPNVTELPGTAVVDMEVVNASLDAVNGLFVREVFRPGCDAGKRRPMGSFLLPESANEVASFLDLERPGE